MYKRGMAKIMIGFKVDPEFKNFLKRLADEENRSLSNFIINAILTYIKEHKNVDYRREKAK